MIICVSLLTYLSFISGFLLDPQSAVTNQRFLTEAEFLDAKKQQQNEMEVLYHKIEQIRHDTDAELSLLTSQIQNKLETIEKKVNIIGNCSDSGLIEEKYNVPVQNHTQLQNKFEALYNNFTYQQHVLDTIKAKSDELNEEIQGLKLLKNIQSLQDLHALQQQVQAISSQTHALSVNEQARNQDFLALYNVTVLSEQTIAELKSMQLQTTTNIASMQQQISKNEKQVALTACKSKDYGRHANQIVRFDSVRTQVGISDVSSFIQSGKFTIEIEGVYIVSAYLISGTFGGGYGVYKDGILVARSYISATVNNVVSTTIVVAVELQRNSTVWIQTLNLMDVSLAYHLDSCLTIIKIK